jgi:hypothetical protein
MEGCPGGGPSCSASGASVSVCSSPTGDQLAASILPPASLLLPCLRVCASNSRFMIQYCWNCAGACLSELHTFNGVTCSKINSVKPQNCNMSFQVMYYH